LVSLIPGWGFLSLMLLASLLTIAGGVAYLVSRRWAWLASVVGGGLLWLAPVLFVVGRLGWANTDLLHHAGKLVVSVALVALPMVGSVRRRGHLAAQE
jgi:hypothetical protein